MQFENVLPKTSTGFCACLEIHLGIPVRVIEDDNVSSIQIDAEATGTRGEQEDEFVSPRSVVLLNLRLAILATCVSCQAHHNFNAITPSLRPDRQDLQEMPCKSYLLQDMLQQLLNQHSN